MFSEVIRKLFNDPRRFNASPKVETKDDPGNSPAMGSEVGSANGIIMESVSYGTRGKLIGNQGIDGCSKHAIVARIDNGPPGGDGTAGDEEAHEYA